MNFLKIFFLREGKNVRLLSYKAFSMGALIKDDKFEGYIEKHINFFAAPILRKKALRKSELPSEPCIVEVSGKVSNMREHKLDNFRIEVSLIEDLSETQKNMAGLPRIVRRALLEDIGIKSKDLCENWNRLDERQTEWQEEQQKYGFDERVTWGLDTEIKRLIYERIVFFKLYSPRESDDDVPKFVFKKRKLTFEEWINEIIEGLMLDITLGEFSAERKKHKAKIENALPMLIKHIDYLWW